MNIHPFDIHWWRYIFHSGDSPGWSSSRRWRDAINRYWCRIKNHPAGAVYYNPGGLEPDDRCKDCGDFI